MKKEEKYSFIDFLLDKKYGYAGPRRGLPLIFALPGSVILVFIIAKDLLPISIYIGIIFLILYIMYLFAKREKRKWKDRK